MRPLGLGEHGEVFYTAKPEGGWKAMVYYRAFSGKKVRIKASGRSKAAARRRVMASVERVHRIGSDGEFTSRSKLEDGAKAWLAMFERQVARGTRAPSTLDLYRHAVDRHVLAGVGSLRLGEVSTRRLDRFLQDVLSDKGYATAKLCRTVLSGICGYLVRQDALPSNPVRDVTPLEADTDRTARALSPEQVRQWLAILDADPVAVRKDLPDLARFMLATGLRLGEALGVHWSDMDMTRGVVQVQRTVTRVKGEGLRASRLKSRTSYRALLLPDWCLAMLQERHERLGESDAPVFPDSVGGYRDRNNVGRDFREVRAGTEFAWVKTHTYRKTVATVLDGAGSSARLIADQLGHSRISMTQDVYMGRRAVDASLADALGALDPDRSSEAEQDGPDDEKDQESA